MDPFPPAAAGGTLRGVPYRASPLGGKVSGALWVFCGLPPGPAGCALPGESVGRKGVGYPTGNFPPPKPSPRGEGAPVRTLGRMRGRSTHPTEREKEGIGATGPSFYKERLGTESPPHQSPSVTASPQGEASGLCSPTRKSVPNQGTQMGPVIAQRSPRCAPPRQNQRVGTSGL